MLKKLLPDRFTCLLTASALLAFVLPARGMGAQAFEGLTDAAIAALFFVHGAKLARREVIAGVANWRLHLLVDASTFVFFPLLGFALKPVLEPLVGAHFYAGVLFLCFCPSTVQSAIAFTSMARGNVPAAVCSASVSNVAGIFITPLLAVLFLGGAQGGLSLGVAVDIVGLLLVPFIAGQALERWIGAAVRRRPGLVSFIDDGSVLLIVYTAFSASVVAGLWRHTPWEVLLAVIGICLLLLGIALVATAVAARALHFSKEDEIAIVFCGSKKSLASGGPMATLMFSASALGPIILPVIIFNQVQIMACAVVARHYARRPARAARARPPRATLDGHAPG
ncbi:MAG TPA: bile acid:sodium symporter family protein [Nevskiaceae bacterium]|nr:bile acid:sodium symporter family protein [Nevskiaceae bacterium]